MARALILGGYGQDGYYISRQLLAHGHQTFVLGRKINNGVTDKVHSLEIDITDQNAISEIISQVKPDWIFNLAGISSVSLCERNPKLSHMVNVGSAKSLLDFLAEYAKKVKGEIFLFQALSSEIYGNPSFRSCDENSIMNPFSIYGEQKLELLHYTIAKKLPSNLRVVNGILFNHESIMRKEYFVTKKIAHEVVSIYQGKSKMIQLGDLNIARDWGFAGDYTNAMYKLAESSSRGEFVIASGKLTTIRDICKSAFNCLGITNWESLVVRDELFVREGEPNGLQGNYDKIRKEIGWEPKTLIQDVILEMVNTELELSR